MNAFQSSQHFRPYLAVGERVLWSGQPKQGLTLSGRDALLVPFSLVWGGFAIFWNAMVWLTPFHASASGGSGWFMRLWGLPFLAIGLYMIAGRFFHDALLRRKLFYAVTDRRIIVLRGRKVSSREIARLPRLELSEHRDGTGTLDFEASPNLRGGGKNFSGWLPALGTSAQFFRIRDPQKVYQLIRDQNHS